MSKNYIFITNIPTPYRNSFYNDLNKVGIRFSVFYENDVESDRNWRPSDFSMNYDHTIFKSFYINIDYFHFHLNPKLIYQVLKLDQNHELIFGLNWNDPNMLIMVILKKIGLLKKKFHFWSEANILTIGSLKDGLFKKFLRRFVFDQADGSHFISGKSTLIALEKWGIKKSHHIQMFNTIDDDIFNLKPEEIGLRGRGPIKFIMPIRLIEKIKGFMNFFNAIGVDAIKKHVFYLAGDGEDKVLIEEFIRVNELSKNIILLGSINSNKMPKYYALADAFILPSFSDPCPLSVIEAMSMKLPILMSTHCGNHYEIIKNSNNGLTFDPFNWIDIATKFNIFVGKHKKFKEMGEENYMNFHKYFKKIKVIESFVNQLNQF